MMATMRITRVQIQHWRSIKYIDFYPQDVCVLVGANNAGKTNILSAINFLIGDRWPMPGNLDDSDFYDRDRERDIKIRIDFKDAAFSFIDFDTSRAQYTLQAGDRNGNNVRGFNNAMREDLAFAYVDASRNFEKQFSASRWSLFGQALRFLHSELKSNEEQLGKLRKTLGEAHDLLQTDLYKGFEENLREAFAAQLKTARYDVAFEFRTIEETNLYRSLYPTLVERGSARSPAEVGSGVRNVLVLALFQAFAKSFRGGAFLGIEEPELYLHPHAQRSLMRQFEELAAAGNQIFISSHSVHFLDVSRSDRIVLVERCEDDEEEVCTQVAITSSDDLLALRKALHPGREITVESMRSFIRNIRTAEMTEAYFARVVVVVEGATEREALPIYARALGLDFDQTGISIVGAGSKSAIDTLVHLYQAHAIRRFIIFDNDVENDGEKATNRTLCRLLGQPEADVPPAQIHDDFAIVDGNWEKQFQAELDAMEDGLYARLEAEARAALGIAPRRNKPLIARFIAESLIEKGMIPPFVRAIVEKLTAKAAGA